MDEVLEEVVQMHSFVPQDSIAEIVYHICQSPFQTVVSNTNFETGVAEDSPIEGTNMRFHNAAFFF